jgi:predicted alpha/beta superfamily hydrolase
MGHVQIHREYFSPPEGFARTVRIYTPDAYDTDPDRRFPVLYMHDGQNVFAHPESAVFHTWCANNALERLVGEGRLEPWIIVALDHTGLGRWPDYTPWDDPKAKVSARGPLYAKFLQEHLKPWVDKTYRTRPEAQWTATMGASLGGLISLYLGLSAPHVFGRIGALSPTVMWSGGRMFQEWKAHSKHWSRIYLDAGANEYINVDGIPLEYAKYTRDFFLHLKKLGYGDHETCLVLEPGGDHNELDWQRRLPFAFRWLLS